MPQCSPVDPRQESQVVKQRRVHRPHPTANNVEELFGLPVAERQGYRKLAGQIVVATGSSVTLPPTGTARRIARLR